MGTLNTLREHLEGKDYFIETGTAEGVSLNIAKQYPFKKLYSIEIDEKLATKAKEKFSDDKTTIINDSSEEGLPEAIKGCGKGTYVFWLDAHYPGATSITEDFNKETNEEIRLPLLKELKIIKKLIKNNDYTIIVDDIRIYDESFGEMPQHIRPAKQNIIPTIKKLFDKKEIIMIKQDEGYMIIRSDKNVQKRNR